MRIVAWLTVVAFVFGASGGANASVQTGLERLFSERLDLIEGKRVAVIGNHTSTNRHGDHLLDLLADHCSVVAAFGPEHGFDGAQSAGDRVGDAMRDGVPIYSLYGEFRIPTGEMLQDAEVLIYDIQDVGVKFYTYISSLFLGMHAAKREGIPIIVLDRPCPLGAERVEGAITHPAYASFVGVIPLPIRYGMTIGELARLFNKESYAGFALDADLHVIEMGGYRRGMAYAETEIPWIAPSPNMPTVETALIYPGTCLIEGTNLSEGRGTEAPFLTVGAPFIDADAWLAALPEEVLAGLDVSTVSFTPISLPGRAENPKFLNQRCNGLRFRVIDADALKPVDLGVALLCAARTLYPGEFTANRFLDRLWGDETLRAMLEAGASYPEVMATTRAGVERFLQAREQYLIYP